jgi:hypothetical protein
MLLAQCHYRNSVIGEIANREQNLEKPIIDGPELFTIVDTRGNARFCRDLVCSYLPNPESGRCQLVFVLRLVIHLLLMLRGQRSSLLNEGRRIPINLNIFRVAFLRRIDNCM